MSALGAVQRQFGDNRKFDIGTRGKFKIWNPTRFEFNVDRTLPEHFALNANLTLNMSGVAGSQKDCSQVTLRYWR